YLRSDLITAVREFFYQIEQDRSGEVAYDGFAREIDQDSVVITLNYDVALERALAKAGKWDIGTGYGFTTFADRTASPTAIYKLHGSVNWFQAPMQENPPPIMFARDLRLLGLPRFGRSEGREQWRRDQQFRDADPARPAEEISLGALLVAALGRGGAATARSA
ncbi:MAG: SIR2 family protein, partial [Acidobacteria bacterium]|nr:SIR2 family protein [Acidobacteriota bacterium]